MVLILPTNIKIKDQHLSIKPKNKPELIIKIQKNTWKQSIPKNTEIIKMINKKNTK